MKKIFAIVFMLLPLCLQAAEYAYQTVPNDPLQARIYTLDNGLQVYLTKNAERPIIQTMIAVRTGGQNDPLESTGLAHYLEHIMFKGTKQYGTTDYEKEKVYLQQIDSLYEIYGKTTDRDEREVIYHKIDSVSYLSSKIAIANEFDKLMDGIGATDVNAFTSNESTCYISAIPASEIDRWAAIESDRFQNLVIRGFHTELEAVYEEYNLHLSQDQEKIILAIDQLLYPELPYRQHSIIGTQEHLKNPSIVNMKNYWKDYYCPNNVAILMSGDLDFDYTINTIAKHFGTWQPNPNIPVVPQYAPSPITAAKETTIYGTEAESLWLGWRFPSATTDDAVVTNILAEILNNGKCGLLDIDLMQKQKILDCGVFPYEGKDYTTFYVIGIPKEKQSLTEVRRLLLGEIEKLKRGEFTDELLEAVKLNQRRSDLQSLSSNWYRVNLFSTSFLYNIPWQQMLEREDRQYKVTKEDIVRVANQYFTDAYISAYKLQGEDTTITKVDKPKISPIEMNRDSVSAFRDSLLKLETPSLQPQFIDFKKDLTISSLKGRELLYKQNTENELFSLSFDINIGSDEDPTLPMANSLLDYIGTKKHSAEQLSLAQYALACDIDIYVDNNSTSLQIYGLEQNLPAALDLLEEWIFEAKADNKIYKAVVADIIQANEVSKTEQRSCFRKLQTYGIYGADFVKKQTLTPKQMKKMKAKKILQNLATIAGKSARITYYGPATEKELSEMLSDSRFLQTAAGGKNVEHPKYLPVTEQEVLIAPYDAQNTYCVAFADWGEVYNPKDEAIIMLFNEYFNGSMGSVVFQEMRESRALAYSAWGNYQTPLYAGDDNYFTTGIISQNDKLRQCIEAFDSICTYMPVSESAFNQAKTSLIKQIEKRRYVRSAPIYSYIFYEYKGWDHDLYEDIYQAVQTMTIDDVVTFQKANVANRKYRYMILGNKDQLDMDFLRTLGPVKELNLQDIFIY